MTAAVGESMNPYVKPVLAPPPTCSLQAVLQHPRMALAPSILACQPVLPKILVYPVDSGV